MSDFDDDFDNFDDDGFDDFSNKGSLKDAWQSSPLMKIFTIIGGIILVVTAIFIFGGADSKDDQSKIANGVDQREVLGGEVSEVYAGAIDDVNRQRREDAVRQGTSSIDMIVNAEQQELLIVDDELPVFDDFDPLQTFRNSISPEDSAVTPQEEEPVLIAPEEIFAPNVVGSQQIGTPQQQVAAPSPEAIQALAQAMSASASSILGSHAPTAGRITQVTPENFLDPVPVTLADGTVVSNNNQFSADAFAQQSIQEEIIQTILVPSGTINYAQILIEANSDVPGPVLAQLVSGPLSGARLIGSFTTAEDVLVLSFNSIVVDGFNQSISAIAIDPNTTLPGVATDVNNRYWQRIVLPAAARFLEGVGAAIAQDTETTVTVSGDTVVEETSSLDLEQELGRGAEEGFQEIAEFMDEQSDGIQPLIRVRRGTPVGIFFTEPVIEVNNNYE